MAEVRFEQATRHLSRRARRRPSTGSTSSSKTASCSSSSGRRGRASRRRCGCWPGLEEVDAGAVYIGERDVTDVPPKHRDIAMVFQNYALYPYLDVRANIGFPLKMAGVRKAERERRVTEAAEMLGLTSLLDSQARSALGRRAPAGRHGASDRAQPAGVPDGRAAVQPRRQAAGQDAGRHRRAAAPARRDDAVRHPRSGRGDDDGSPRRGACATGACSSAARRASSTARRPTCSWPASSARRR